MEYRLRLSELPFFNFISSSFSKKMRPTFTIVKKSKGDTIINYGEDVPGLFVIAEGEVEVFARSSDILIATLKGGSSFGEMSLIENETSSATLKAGSDKVIMLLCKRDVFNKLLADDFVFSAAFYKGAAQILSSRLRNTNTRIEGEMDKGRTVIQNMIDKDGVLAKLGHTQFSLNDTGESMIAKLSNLLPDIESIKLDLPNASESLESIKKTIKQVLTIDSQSFDLISQQMDQINQYMINIQRIMSGLDIHEVKGDKNIFQINKTRHENDEDAITFF
ncbi:MAG: cyclic nucleotide-binding domain-containing protein [Spirochaetia bacterium]|nr:cyclic nucleotide-binding domain-containing protein [Spirochaetia bacterium]